MSRHGFSPLLAAALTLGAAAARAQPTTCTLPLLGADRLGPATELARKGQTLYLVAGAALLTIDITDPLHPVTRSRLDLDFEPLELSVSGPVLAAAAGERGLVLFDLTDPDHPVRAGELDTPGSVSGVSSSPDRVFVADLHLVNGPPGRGVLIVDSSDPNQPVEIGSHAFGVGGAVDVVAKYGVAYALESYGQLHLIDVTDPTATTELGSVDVYGEKLKVGGHGNRVFVYHFYCGHHVYAQVSLIDATDRTAPKRRGYVYSFDEDDSLFSSFAIGDARLFLGDCCDSFWIYDVSDLDHPTLISELPGTPGSRDLVHFDGYVYAASGEDGLQIIDVSDPTAPLVVASRSTPSETRGILARDRVAIVRGRNDLRFFDAFDPASPAPLGGIPGLRASDAQTPVELAAAGSLLHVPEPTGFRIVDWHTPSLPATLGHFEVSDPALGIAAADGTVYVSLYDGYGDGDSLRVVDVGDPGNPVEIGAWGPAYWEASRMALDGDLLAVDGATGTVDLLDVSEPSAPTVRAWIDLGSHTRALAWDGDFLYVGTYQGLGVVDLSNRFAPVVRGSLTFGSERVRDLAVDHRRAVVALDDSHLRLVDLRDPDAPTIIGEATTSGDGIAVDFERGRIYVADGSSGFAIYGDCPFFADGFESGDTSGWSSASP